MEKPKPDPRASIGTRLKEFEAAEAQRILGACTQCGKCYEVCPMARYSSAPAATGKDVVPGVLAVLRGERGSDAALRHEFLVYSAHWDHLGIRQEQSGDHIYNGAVDNATGISGMPNENSSTTDAVLRPMPLTCVSKASASAGVIEPRNSSE